MKKRNNLKKETKPINENDVLKNEISEKETIENNAFDSDTPEKEIIESDTPESNISNYSALALKIDPTNSSQGAGEIIKPIKGKKPKNNF